VPRHVVVLTRDASLVIAVKALLNDDDRVSELESPQDLPPLGDLPVDAVVVDLPSAARRASIDRVRGRFSGPLVVLLQHGEDPAKARVAYRCSVLTRPFGMSQLWSMLVESASEALTEILPAIKRDGAPVPRPESSSSPPRGAPGSAPVSGPTVRPAASEALTSARPPAPGRHEWVERPERPVPAVPERPAPVSDRPETMPERPRQPEQRPAAATTQRPSAPMPERHASPAPNGVDRPAAGLSRRVDLPAAAAPERVERPAPAASARPEAVSERPAPSAPYAAERRTASAPAASERRGEAEVGERPVPPRASRTARAQGTDTRRDRVAPWNWRLRRFQQRAPRGPEPSELTQPMPSVPPAPPGGNGVAPAPDRAGRRPQPSATHAAKAQPQVEATPPAQTPRPAAREEVIAPDPPATVAGRLAERLGADVMALLLDNNRGLLEVAGGVGLTANERQLQVEYGHEVLLELFRVGVGLIEDTERVRPLIRGIPGSRSQSLVMVPLVHEGHGFGALIIGRTSAPGQPRPEFTEPEIEALMDFAEDVAAPLRSTVLLRRLKGQLNH
jgi:hypothetical protein